MTGEVADRTGSPSDFPPAGSDEWQAADAEALGWDTAQLEVAFRYADEKNTSGLLILHRGRIMAERYWRDGSLHAAGDVASVQKSFTAVLIGIAQERGLITVGDTVSKWLGEGWSNAPATVESRITLRHLLTMTSGLDPALASEAEPGTAWFYNTPAYHLLKDAIEAAAGESIQDFSRHHLFEPIGLQDTEWRERPNMAAPQGARARASGAPQRLLTGLVCSTRDLARFGLLVLENGAWEGREVVGDKTYLAAMVDSSQSLNPAYGYLWWLNGKASYVLPGRGRSGTGPMIAGGPADLVCALGAGDKKVYVSRSLGLVVSRHGAPSGQGREDAVSSFDSELWSRILAAAPGR